MNLPYFAGWFARGFTSYRRFWLASFERLDDYLHRLQGRRTAETISKKPNQGEEPCE